MSEGVEISITFASFNGCNKFRENATCCFSSYQWYQVGGTNAWGTPDTVDGCTWLMR